MTCEGTAMTENVENLTHEMLQRVHGKLDEIQAEIRLRPYAGFSR